MQKISLDEYVENTVSVRNHTYAQAGSNGEDIERIARAMRCAIEQDLTEKQRITIEKYYFEHMSITKIARQLGVNKSTVSRNMKAARHKLNRLLKYSFGRFTADAQTDSPPLNTSDNCAPQRGQ